MINAIIKIYFDQDTLNFFMTEDLTNEFINLNGYRAA